MNTINNQDLTFSGLNAIQFCHALAADPSYADIYLDVPTFMVEQAQAGLKSFEINADHINEEEIRIAINDPQVINDNEVSFKLSLSGVMDYDTGEMIPISQRDKGDKAQRWLPGYNSLRMSVKRDDNLFTSNQFDMLVRYADWYANQVAEGVNMWAKGMAGKRVYITPASADFLFQFTLDVRLNPANYNLAIGLSQDIQLRNAHLLCTFAANPAGSIGKAKKQRTGRALSNDGSSIPSPRR